MSLAMVTFFSNWSKKRAYRLTKEKKETSLKGFSEILVDRISVDIE